jgi:hypothetical protein
MTEVEARTEAGRRNAEGTEPGFWAAQHGDGDEWRVVKISGAGLGRTRPTGSHSESKPKPSQPDDPRPGIFQNLPPYGLG